MKIEPHSEPNRTHPRTTTAHFRQSFFETEASSVDVNLMSKVGRRAIKKGKILQMFDFWGKAKKKNSSICTCKAVFWETCDASDFFWRLHWILEGVSESAVGEARKISPKSEENLWFFSSTITTRESERIKMVERIVEEEKTSDANNGTWLVNGYFAC